MSDPPPSAIFAVQAVKLAMLVAYFAVARRLIRYIIAALLISGFIS